MADEIQSHIDGLAERHIAEGMSPKEARYTAMRAFGGVEQIKERSRDERGVLWVEQLVQDLHYASRTLWKSPLFTSVAVLTLAIGIGANTAVFSVVESILLGTLPYPESERVVAVWERHPDTSNRNVVSAGNYLDWKEQNTVFESMAAFAPIGAVLRGEGPPQQSIGARVTPGMFDLLRVQPQLGRGFMAGENAEVGGREIVISHSTWQTRYGGRADIVGTKIHLDDTPMTIVGVMPATFEFPSSRVDFWLGLRFDVGDRESRKLHQWRVLGRLKPGVPISSAQAEMDVLVSRIAAEHPEFMTGWGVNVVPYHTDLVRNARSTILILTGMVALVLFVACANVGNLMLARSAGRQRELAIRGALGAGRGRIVRQLLTESVLLSGLGAVGGLLFATWAMGFLASLTPPGLPGFVEPHLSGGALASAALALVVATGIIGLAPAWWLSRIDLRSFLQGGRAESGGVLLRRTRNLLLVTQLALATMLLVGSGLLLRSMAKLHQVDFGFDPKKLISATLNLPRTRYPTTAEHAAFYERVKVKLESIPGIQSVAGISDTPLGRSNTFSFVISGRPRSGPNPRETALEKRAVTPGYFETIRLSLMKGRDFAEFDDAESPTVVIVNRAFEQLHFPYTGAVGQRLSHAGHGGPWMEIVGVVGDIKDKGLDQPASPAMYVPYLQKRNWRSALTVMIRTSVSPELVQEDIRRAFAAMDAELPLRRMVTMSTLYAGRLAQRDFMTKLTSGFALLTLCLGVIGVYGVVSYSVAQRRREFGICLALGTRRWDITGRVMREGVKLVGIGAFLGALGAVGLARFLGNLLFEIQPLDLPTFVAVVGVLGGISLFALWLPARRAAKVDPMVALRCE